MDSVSDIVRGVRTVLEGDERVALGYLFGSVAQDRMGPLSDIDVGVLSFPNIETEQFPGVLADELCRALQTDRVDLVDLRDAPIPLRCRVIRDGKLLVSRDERVRERFETASIMRYLDMKPVRERCFEVARRQIVETAK
jgi:hypothetical protein